MPDEKLPIISVRGAGTDRKVVLWEQHPDHPDEGEAFVVNEDKAVQVAETALVKQKLADGSLVKADSGTAETPSTETPAPSETMRRIPRSS